MDRPHRRDRQGVLRVFQGPQLRAVAVGFIWYDLGFLPRGLPIFSTLYFRYIALEESMIYPQARLRQALTQGAKEGRKAAK